MLLPTAFDVPPAPPTHTQEGAFKLSQVLKVAVEVSKGMDYLHQRKIIHRDLKVCGGKREGHV